MTTIFQYATIALAITLSAEVASAQQPIRKSTKPLPSATKAKTPGAPATKSALATAAKAPTAPQPTAAMSATPVVARQTEANPQAVAQAAPVRPQAKMAANRQPLLMNAGVGVATYYGGGFPIGVSVEAGLTNKISVGGSVDFLRHNYGYYSGNYTFVLGGARASYHLADALSVTDTKFDPYVGATLGFRYANYHDAYGTTYSDYGAGYNSGLWIGIHVGARYFFSPKLGGFAEVGYGVSALKLGITAKF